MPRKQRHRPDAGVEVVYYDNRYSAVKFSDPLTHTQHIEVYAQPYHDLLFKLDREGPRFWCKRCQAEHQFSWYEYDTVAHIPQILLYACATEPALIYFQRALTPDEAELMVKVRSFI